VNNGKMWLMVKPSVGLPLFFISIALTSLIVHAAILTHTTWYPAYYQGSAGKVRTVAVAAPADAVAAPVGTPSVVINVGPGGVTTEKTK
jgi:light-harvesting protein B-800-850 alpha chain